MHFSRIFVFLSIFRGTYLGFLNSIFDFFTWNDSAIRAEHSVNYTFDDVFTRLGATKVQTYPPFYVTPNIAFAIGRRLPMAHGDVTAFAVAW